MLFIFRENSNIRYFAYISVFFAIVVCAGLFSCDPEKPVVVNPPADTETLTYLNHADSATYVGINTCK
ncbi:MAG: hypothetical protein O9353_07245, partial [Bacteroidia bacterium]|nr:hypothetical protein [Bacteroidia bacterium]